MRGLRLLAAAALVLAGAAAHAHNYHMGMADISYNEHTGSTEIVHTYAAHDLAALLTNLYGRQFDLGRADSEAPLRRYVDQQFHIADANRRRLPLEWVGVKVDADSVVIFQELPKLRLGSGTRIHNALLIDFLPSQKNNVNLQTDGTSKTLLFDQGSIDQVVP